jgi:hypothetical protein
MASTYLTGTFSVIHSTGTTDFNNYVYSALYFNTNGTYTINGTSVTGVAGKTLDIIVQQSGTTLNNGYVLLGNLKPAGLFQTGLITSTGGTEQYRFVDIKTGLPTNG